MKKFGKIIVSGILSATLALGITSGAGAEVKQPKRDYKLEFDTMRVIGFKQYAGSLEVSVKLWSDKNKKAITLTESSIDTIDGLKKGDKVKIVIKHKNSKTRFGVTKTLWKAKEVPSLKK